MPLLNEWQCKNTNIVCTQNARPALPKHSSTCNLACTPKTCFAVYLHAVPEHTFPYALHTYVFLKLQTYIRLTSFCFRERLSNIEWHINVRCIRMSLKVWVPFCFLFCYKDSAFKKMCPQKYIIANASWGYFMLEVYQGFPALEHALRFMHIFVAIALLYFVIWKCSNCRFS